MSIFQFESKMNKDLKRIKPNGIDELSMFWNDKPITSTNYVNNPFTIEDIMNTCKKTKQLSPVAIEMQVYREGMYVLQENISVIDDFRKEELNKEHEFLCHFDGVKIIVIEKDLELKRNQGKILYSDGSYKIIDIFN